MCLIICYKKINLINNKLSNNNDNKKTQKVRDHLRKWPSPNKNKKFKQLNLFLK